MTSRIVVAAGVIIAIPGATECGMLADWLFSEGYDPAKRPTARSAPDVRRAAQHSTIGASVK